MSRLQVGGLALIIGSVTNCGKVVRLKRYIGDFKGRANCWHVTGEDLLDIGFNRVSQVAVPESWLLPLGDKQTQDELAKELENDTTVSNTL